MLDATSLEVACPKCAVPFVPARSNQTYCSKACQKNATRAPRTVAASNEERRRQECRSGRLQGLSDTFFETPPKYRTAFMLALINEGRRKSELRAWLIQRELLCHWVHHEGSGRLHIVQCLDHFCREVFGQRSFEVLQRTWRLRKGQKPVFPAIYFGPTEPSIYTDGLPRSRPFAKFCREAAPNGRTSPRLIGANHPASPRAMPDVAFWANLATLRMVAPLTTLPTDEEVRARYLKKVGCEPTNVDDDLARVDQIIFDVDQAVVRRRNPPPPL